MSDPNPYQTMLDQVRGDIAKLKGLEAYLLKKMAESGCVAGSTEDIPVDLIEKTAQEMAALGGIIRAKDVANRLIPTYSPRSDRRAFVDRVYMVLIRHRHLKKCGRGRFHKGQ